MNGGIYNQKKQLLNQFKTIEAYKHYEVNELGQVRSKDRIILTIDGKTYFRKGRLHRPKRHKDGYLFVTLTCNNNKRNFYVHRLVAAAFIPNPENKPQVNHINGIKSDNTIGNLEWVTNAENAKHAVANALYYDIGQLKPTSQPVLDTSSNKCYHTIKEAAIALNRNYTVIREMLKGRRRKTIPLEYCDVCG